MAHDPEHGPRLRLHPEPSPAQRTEMLAQLRRMLLPPPPAPTAALHLLYETACADTGGSQAARNFLFWLAGRPDPTGFQGSGALEILRWWSGPTKSDEPLYAVLARLRERFAPADKASDPDQA